MRMADGARAVGRWRAFAARRAPDGLLVRLRGVGGRRYLGRRRGAERDRVRLRRAKAPRAAASVAPRTLTTSGWFEQIRTTRCCTAPTPTRISVDPAGSRCLLVTLLFPVTPVGAT